MFTEYVSGELGPLERAIVDDHLAECVSCRAELAATRELGGLLSRQPLARCPERVTDAILAAVADEDPVPVSPANAAPHPAPRPRPAMPRRRWRRATGVAAALAAAVLLALVLPTGDPAPTGPDPTEVAQARHEFLWTLAYTASVIDRSEKQSIANVLRELRERTPASHTAAIPGGEG
jgi:anti-sigma factor RsiW